MARVDANSDGKIDWKEFSSKFVEGDLENRLQKRANERLARLKELMILHMTGANDAFRLVSPNLNSVTAACSLQAGARAALDLSPSRSSTSW